MLEKSMKPDSLPLKVWRGDRVPADVRAVVNEEDLLNIEKDWVDEDATAHRGPDD